MNKNITGSDKICRLRINYLYLLQAAYNFITAFLAEAYRPLWPGSWDVTHSQAEALLSSSSECAMEEDDLYTILFSFCPLARCKARAPAVPGAGGGGGHLGGHRHQGPDGGRLLR